MITVISGTARSDSNTLRIALLYQRLLGAQSTELVQLLSLEGLQVWERGAAFEAIEAGFLIPASRFVFIMPEYNGSFPGMLKTMIDNTDIKACWWGKKALLTGIADGRAGNLRGLEHFTGILQYLHMHVYWDKIPLSRIKTEISAEGTLINAATEVAIEAQISGFLKF